MSALNKHQDTADRKYIKMVSKSLIIYIILIFGLSPYLLMSQQVIDTTQIFGVTIDNARTDMPAINNALSSHTIKPTVRIVFDNFVPAADYIRAVQNISNTSFIMGEIIDSYRFRDYTIEQYLDRTKEYLDQFEDIVDIWEIGNEVNGDWLGEIDDTVQKIEGAYQIVIKRGLSVALNFYYNRDCYNKPQYEMFNWINANLSKEIKQGLDYVFFSYYEDDCENVVLSQQEWQAVFDSLHALFPNSKLGFGEIGTRYDNKKAEYMRRYYLLNITTPDYIGGYFWWYYQQDCIPKTKVLWDTLNSIISSRLDTTTSSSIIIND
jgi:hypothetical protein